MALEGDPASWADELGGIAALGFQTLLVGVPTDAPLDFIQRLGEDVAPQLRDAAV
jgi:hypothetical protein